jgi:hypothetical protein
LIRHDLSDEAIREYKALSETQISMANRSKMIEHANRSFGAALSNALIHSGVNGNIFKPKALRSAS